MRSTLTCIVALTLTGCYSVHILDYRADFRELADQGDEPPFISANLSVGPTSSVRWASAFFIPYGERGSNELYAVLVNRSMDPVTVDLAALSILHAGRKDGVAMLAPTPWVVPSSTAEAEGFPVATLAPGAALAARFCPAGFDRGAKDGCDLWAWLSKGGDGAKTTALVLPVMSNGRQLTVTRTFTSEVSSEKHSHMYWIWESGK